MNKPCVGQEGESCRKNNLCTYPDCQTWEGIEKEYLKEEYPIHGGPFTDALSPFEWLKKHYHPPKIK